MLRKCGKVITAYTKDIISKDLKGLKHPIVMDHFNLALYELENGTTLEEMQLMLMDYERKELYLECAGIYKALDFMNFITFYYYIRYALEYYKIDIETNQLEITDGIKRD